jgi:hypothetical protein
MKLQIGGLKVVTASEWFSLEFADAIGSSPHPGAAIRTARSSLGGHNYALVPRGTTELFAI